MPAGDGFYVRLQQAVTELTRLLGELEAVLPFRPREGFRPAGASGTPGRPGASLTSWNQSAAWVILEVHAGARELEQNMKYRLSGIIRERGGSDGNTIEALKSVISITAGAGEWELGHAVRTVERWCWKARLSLGEIEPWVAIPRQPGRRAARCIFCGYATLRMKPLTGSLRCVNPACTDTDGQRPAGRVEFGAGFGEPMLVWNSGDIGVVQEKEEEATE